MTKALLIENNGEIAIKTPYNASLVEEIKSLPNRRWNGVQKAWIVPASREQEVREIVRKYFMIEGEESTVEHEVLDLVVWADNTYKRSYPHGVTVDGCDIVNMAYGSLVRSSNAFEILESKGGFVKGDSSHAYEVCYEIKLKVRKGAVIEGYGRCGKGSFEIVEAGKAVAEPVKVKRAKKVSPAVAAMQLPEGKKACLVRGKLVVK